MPEQPHARLISNATLWQLHVAQGRRNQVADWLQANGLDPLAVLSTDNVTVEDAEGGGRLIRCTVVEKDADHPEERVVPCVVPPPDGWPVYAVPGPA